MESLQISIPYHAPTEELPCEELPNTHAIEASKEILSDTTGRKVVGIGPDIIVKYGLQVDLDEGLTMIFVERTITSVLVPKVYALFRDPESRRNYIVMERINGTRLDSIWSSLDDGRKQNIASQLKAAFIEMRKLPSPNQYCSLDSKPLRDHIFYFPSPEEFLKLEGPFKSEDELNNAMIRKYLSSGYLPRGKATYYERSFPSVFSGHPPTFTHGDFQKKNLILSVKDGRVAILDWEFAGWYPSYWEYARSIFACGQFDDDWSKWVDGFLDVYRNEWVWMQMLICELWS